MQILIYLNLGVLMVVYNLWAFEKTAMAIMPKSCCNDHGFVSLDCCQREYVIKNMQCHVTYQASITCFSSLLFSWKVVTWSLWRWVVLSGQGLHICVHMWLTTYLNHVGGYGFCYVINMSGIYNKFW
jgi:hypothetical protein